MGMGYLEEASNLFRAAADCVRSQPPAPAKDMLLALILIKLSSFYIYLNDPKKRFPPSKKAWNLPRLANYQK